MNVPETIYLHRYQNGLGSTVSWPTLNKVDGNSIPYDRRKACVWRVEGEAGVQGCHPERPVFWIGDAALYDYCPYCGGRVEIADSDAGAVNA